MRLMQRIRDSIKNESFPQFVKDYVLNYYSDNANENGKESCIIIGKSNVPEWIVDALKSVNIDLNE
jgi:hypothetical protein